MKKHYKVLVVDDKPWWSNLFKKVLSEHGYKVDVESNGEEVLNKLDRQKYDIIVMDFYVSGADGVASLRRILNKHSKERVIVVSACPTWEEGRDIFMAGAIDYLSKPADETRILKAIRENLKKKPPLASTTIMS